MSIPYLECASTHDFMQALRELQITQRRTPDDPIEVMAIFRTDTTPGRMGRWITAHLEATCLVRNQAGDGRPLYILRYREFVYERSEYDQDNPERFAALRLEAMERFKAGMGAENVRVKEGYAWSGE